MATKIFINTRESHGLLSKHQWSTYNIRKDDIFTAYDPLCNSPVHTEYLPEFTTWHRGSIPWGQMLTEVYTLPLGNYDHSHDVISAFPLAETA